MTKGPPGIALCVTGEEAALPKGKFRIATSQGKLQNPRPLQPRSKLRTRPMAVRWPRQLPTCVWQARKTKANHSGGGNGTKAKRCSARYNHQGTGAKTNQETADLQRKARTQA